MKNKILILVLFSIFSIACSNDNTKEETKSTNNNSIQLGKKKQLNITIVLDLSDRIEPSINPSNPEHFERDIEIVKYFTEIFKQDMQNKGAYKAKGKLKVILSPHPQVEELSDVISRLSVDLSQEKMRKKRKRFLIILQRILKKI